MVELYIQLILQVRDRQVLHGMAIIYGLQTKKTTQSIK